MKIISAMLLSVIIIFALAGKCMAFSDADLEKYQTGGGNFIRSDEPINLNSNASPQNSVTGSSTEGEKDHWCQRGEQNRQRLKKAENELQAAEEQLRVLKAAHQLADGSSKTWENKYSHSTDFAKLDRMANDVLDAMTRSGRASIELNKAKDELRTIEDEAHRGSIPPGWVRCQFE
ncbi:MAG: hypothetical protein EPN25_09315 [Nitrospirae bacterium]|nr:MAG: hypothetical protein EPN25_09315 [Nitrospirota bacterium]